MLQQAADRGIMAQNPAANHTYRVLDIAGDEMRANVSTYERPGREWLFFIECYAHEKRVLRLMVNRNRAAGGAMLEIQVTRETSLTVAEATNLALVFLDLLISTLNEQGINGGWEIPPSERASFVAAHINRWYPPISLS